MNSKEKRKIYYLKNKLRYENYYQENIESYKERYFNYYKENKQRINEYNRNYYKRNRSKLCEYNKLYWKSYHYKKSKLLINDYNINNLQSYYPSEFVTEHYSPEIKINRNVKVTFF